MEVLTGLVPNEFVGYHPMEHYNRNGWKKNGPLIPTLPLLMCIVHKLTAADLHEAFN